MEGPSRSRMMQHKPQKSLVPQKHGDFKIQESFTKGRTTDLVIVRSAVTPEFIKAFCAEHSITLKIQGDYYYLS